MGILREKFERILDLKRYSPRTKESYLSWMIALVKHYRKSPDTITDEEIQKYLHHIQNERKLAWPTCNQAAWAISFFYRYVMERRDFKAHIDRRRTPQTIPEILSTEEVRRLIDAADNLKHKTMLMTVYGTGVRVSELVNIRINDIERSRGMLKVRQGKGMKDRYTIIPESLMKQFDAYWDIYRPKDYFFCSHYSNNALTIATAQQIYNHAKKKQA